MARNTFHVVPNGDEWQVRREGADRASSTHSTQAQAVEQARNWARQEHGQLKIHGENNLIREEHTYRKDPFPPKG